MSTSRAQILVLFCRRYVSRCKRLPKGPLYTTLNRVQCTLTYTQLRHVHANYNVSPETHRSKLHCSTQGGGGGNRVKAGFHYFIPPFPRNPCLLFLFCDGGSTIQHLLPRNIVCTVHQSLLYYIQYYVAQVCNMHLNKINFCCVNTVVKVCQCGHVGKRGVEMTTELSL